jgi:triacylglycerol esterase/lipase EstA (alpha/beta hydrolase family)
MEAGEGHPMVLLHGLMGGLSNFDEMSDTSRKKDLKYSYHNFLFMICLF